MNILLSSKTLPASVGGLSAYQLKLYEQLENQGHKVRFVAQRGESSDFLKNHRLNAKAFCLDGVGKLQREQFFRSLASRPRLHGFLERLFNRAYAPRLLSAFADWVPDAVHFTGTGWDFFGFALARFARSAGVPFSVWPAVHPSSWGDDIIDLRLYSLADTVFCQSDYEAEHLQSRGLCGSRIARCSPPAVCRTDGDGRRLREERGLGDRPVVLFLGRRDRGKGYEALLQAWPMVLMKQPGAVLMLAGKGGEEFEALKQALPEGSACDLGVPDEQQKADAYDACTVFCLPSEHESYGIVYVEAWLYGKPVICGTAPASRELVDNRRLGLWGNQEPRDLSGKIVSLLQLGHDSWFDVTEAKKVAEDFENKLAMTHLDSWVTSTKMHE